MRQRLEQWLSELARRAGFKDVPVAVVAGAAVTALVIVMWAGWRWWPRGEPAMDGAGELTALGGSAATPVGGMQASDSRPVASEATATPSTSAAVFVHVAGNVRRPGVYELPEGSRVVDAIDAAGGTVGDAAPDGLNLARVVADGEQVFMPSEKDVLKPPVAPGGVGAAAGGSGATATAQIDLNSADIGQLETLPGVGPSTASKIVAEREANGPFTSVDDLARVSGIGPKKLEQLRNLVYVR